MRDRIRGWTVLISLIVLTVSSTKGARGAVEDEKKADEENHPFEQLEYRHIGPVGNRVIAVVGVPGDPNIYYFGAEHLSDQPNSAMHFYSPFLTDLL